MEIQLQTIVSRQRFREREGAFETPTWNNAQTKQGDFEGAPY